MKQSYLNSLFSLQAQLLSAVNQAGKKKEKNNNQHSERVGIIFANFISIKKFTEATVSTQVCDSELDGGDSIHGPSVMCQSTFF